MTTRADIRGNIESRLNDAANAIWTEAELNQYIDSAIKSLYPTYWKFQTDTTTAGAGPIQTAPSGARNIYFIGLQTATSTRVRLLRQWREGDGEAYVPKTGITGSTLVWAWTAPYDSPNDDVTSLACGVGCEEVIILRSCISALERVVNDRVKSNKYYALTVREGVTEQDIAVTLDALHASLEQRLKQAVPRPERVG